MKTLIEDFAVDLKERDYMSTLMFLYPGSSFTFFNDMESGEIVNTLIIRDKLKRGSRFRPKFYPPGAYQRDVARLLGETFPGLYEAEGFDAIYDAACARRDGTLEFAAYQVTGCPLWLEGWFEERMSLYKREGAAKKVAAAKAKARKKG